MARPRTTRLRETPDAAPPGATVIDVNFTVVRRGKRRDFVGRARWMLAAIAIAAAVGFAIPPAVMLGQAAFGLG